MFPDRRWATCSAALSMLALSGCPSPPELTWEGEHVRLGAEEPEAICGGTRAYLDRRAGELKARFGASHMIDYYWVPSGAEPFCPKIKGGVWGCAVEHEVFAEEIPLEHELVHAAATGMPRALEEGLATHWGDPWPYGSMASRERLRELLEQRVDISTSQEYARSAHFMAYLSESFGWESLVDLDLALDERSSVDEIDQAFMTVFGSSLSDTLLDYESYPDCLGIVDMSLACAEEAVTINALSPTISRDVDCASSDAMGPYDGMVFVEDVIDLAPSIGGTRIFQASGDGLDKGGHVLMRRCGLCTEEGVGVARNPGFVSVDEEDLPAGRYVLRFYVPATETPAHFELYFNG